MNLIALTGENFEIGKDGEQILYIPDDLKHFKDLTLNKTVILGRKTLYTFPDKKPLKGRNNIILSRNKNLKIENAKVFNSLEEVLKNAPDDSFVIGGEEIYKEFMPFCKKAFITMVYSSFEADKFLPFSKKEWELKQDSQRKQYDKYSYSFRIYEKIEGR